MKKYEAELFQVMALKLLGVKQPAPTTERLQRVIEEVTEWAYRHDEDPDEVIARWIEDKLELNTMNYERNGR